MKHGIQPISLLSALKLRALFHEWLSDTGKRCFKVVYLDGDVFRDYMFEASIEKAEEIVEQV